MANADRIRNVARIITDCYKEGNQVVAVLSAQGDTTDDLIEKAAEINLTPPSGRWNAAVHRRADFLLPCAPWPSRLWLSVVSLTGWQAGMKPTSVYSNARIKRVGERIRNERTAVPL